jgi:hypothetical protein
MNPLSWQKAIRAWELFKSTPVALPLESPSGTILGTVRIDVETGKMLSVTQPTEKAQGLTR